MARDEFPERVRRTVAERSAYICTNPTCRRPTVEPHSDPNKSLKTGEACHIHAASPGGPRFDPEQNRQQRSGIENAIWLCTECSTRIDSNAADFAAELLLNWKVQHEEWIKNGAFVPPLPHLLLTTSNGISLPEESGRITGEECKKLREHSLIVKNTGETLILNVKARVQLPEAVVQSSGKSKPPGSAVHWQPNRSKLTAVIKGGGTVTRNGPPAPARVYELGIDKLPPGESVAIDFWTIENSDRWSRPPLQGAANDKNRLSTFIDGNMYFEYHGAWLRRKFFAPISVDCELRRFSVVETRSDFGMWTPLGLTEII